MIYQRSKQAHASFLSNKCIPFKDSRLGAHISSIITRVIRVVGYQQRNYN
jgi:hypothetical protein